MSTATATVLLPRELAERWRMDLDSVYTLIKSRKLAAFDVSAPGSRRPSYRISAAEVERFEAGRPASPPGPPRRKRSRPERRPDGWIEFV